ncbi:hypothetical protein WA538_005304 [Blastocystis sp. DL]
MRRRNVSEEMTDSTHGMESIGSDYNYGFSGSPVPSYVPLCDHSSDLSAPPVSYPGGGGISPNSMFAHSCGVPSHFDKSGYPNEYSVSVPSEHYGMVSGNEYSYPSQSSILGYGRVNPYLNGRRATYDVSLYSQGDDPADGSMPRNHRFNSESTLPLQNSSFYPPPYHDYSMTNSVAHPFSRPRGYALSATLEGDLFDDPSEVYSVPFDYSDWKQLRYLPDAFPPDAPDSYAFPYAGSKPFPPALVARSPSTGPRKPAAGARGSFKGKARKGEAKKPGGFSDLPLASPDEIDPNVNPRVFSGKKPKRRMDYSKCVINLEKVRSGEDSRLTLMLKNIPNDFTQEKMLGILDSVIPNQFDFFYMPVDFKTNCNLGFGYVSVVSADSLLCLYNSLNGKTWSNTPSTKVCEVFYARMQVGKEECDSR